MMVMERERERMWLNWAVPLEYINWLETSTTTLNDGMRFFRSRAGKYWDYDESTPLACGLASRWDASCDGIPAVMSLLNRLFTQDIDWEDWESLVNHYHRSPNHDSTLIVSPLSANKSTVHSPLPWHPLVLRWELGAFQRRYAMPTGTEICKIMCRGSTGHRSWCTCRHHEYTVYSIHDQESEREYTWLQSAIIFVLHRCRKTHPFMHKRCRAKGPGVEFVQTV